MDSLVEAVKENNLSKVKDILKTWSQNDLEELSKSSAPLCVACRVNSKDIVELLLSHGVAINLPFGVLEQHPLHWACFDKNDRVDLVKILLEAGADIHAVEDDGNTGLHLACHRSNLKVVRLLIESGADVTVLNYYDESPLVRACYGDKEEILDLLLRYGAQPTEGCLMMCMLHDFFRGVSKMYKLLPDVMPIDGDFRIIKYMKWCESRKNLLQRRVLTKLEEYNDPLPPLHIACANADPSYCTYKTVISLLEVRPDVHSRNIAGYNCLQHACTSCNSTKLKIIQVLLAYGVNAQDDSFRPMWKCFSGLSINNFKDYLMTLKLLRAAGFRIDEESARMFIEAADHDIYEGDREQFKDFLQIYSLQPLSLKEQARVKIRRQIPVNIDENIVRLLSVLPSILISYLRFEDLIEPIPFE